MAAKAVFPNRWRHCEAALDHWYHFKPSQRPRGGLRAEPEGTSCRGSLRGSQCLVRTPGGLGTSCSLQVASTNARAGGRAPAEPREQTEHLLSARSSSAPPQLRLDPFCQAERLWFQPLRSCAPVFLLYLPFICQSRRSHPAPRVSVRLLGYTPPL